MTCWLRVALLGWLLIGATAQFDLDLSDALGDDDPTVAPAKPPVKPKDAGTDDLDLDLLDAFGPVDPVDPKKPAAGGVDPVVPVVPVDPKKPAGGEVDPVDPKKPAAGGGDELDLFDALGPDLEPEKPAVPPKNGGTGGGGGSFGDGDLVDVAGGAGGDYKPDGGRSGGRASDPAYDPNQGGGAADQPQEAGSIAGIASAIGVALLGAASSYFAYQKKKLCFKIQGGQDPESGKDHRGTESEPQVLSNLLSSS